MMIRYKKKTTNGWNKAENNISNTLRTIMSSKLQLKMFLEMEILSILINGRILKEERQMIKSSDNVEILNVISSLDLLNKMSYLYMIAEKARHP